jgi:hypothetical protein
VISIHWWRGNRTQGRAIMVPLGRALKVGFCPTLIPLHSQTVLASVGQPRRYGGPLAEHSR